MSNVMVLGVGPLPVEKAEKLHAPGIRTWHLASSIARHKHNVMIGLIQFGDFTDTSAGVMQGAPESLADNITVCRFKYHSEQTPEALATMHLRARFNCIVSTTDIMNSVAANIPARIPLWLDYLGDPFTEKQVMSSTFGNDASLLDQWRFVARALGRGDRFSVASTPQKHALIGQLGFAGRLNQFNSGIDLIHVLPNIPKPVAEKDIRLPTQLKGRSLPEKSFLLLWSGGYNTWTDPDTLFSGVADAMKANPLIHYVSAGGEIAGHDNVTFQRFRQLVDESELKKQFHFLGWIPANEVPGYYRQADAAINVDSLSYEAEIGTRTRIIDWLTFEVPIITTPLCEPARQLEHQGLIEPFQPENPASLTKAILNIANDPQSAKWRAKRAYEFFNQQYDQDRMLAPLIEWVKDPVFAADRIVQGSPELRRQPQTDSPLVEQHERFLVQTHSLKVKTDQSLVSWFKKKVTKTLLGE